jgi:hypothetical protein
MRSINKDDKGQSALFDAVIFLAIMIIASGLVGVYANQYSKGADLTEREDMVEYTKNTAGVVLAATLSSTWYEDIRGNVVNKPPGDTKVMNLILEELYLLNHGVPKGNFVMGYEHDIKILIQKLIPTHYHFALSGSYFKSDKKTEHKIFISDLVPDYSSKEEVLSDKTVYRELMPRSNLASCGFTMPMVGISGEAELFFYIWL